jgi:hypothetical protein
MYNSNTLVRTRITSPSRLSLDFKETLHIGALITAPPVTLKGRCNLQRSHSPVRPMHLNLPYLTKEKQLCLVRAVLYRCSVTSSATVDLAATNEPLHKTTCLCGMFRIYLRLGSWKRVFLRNQPIRHYTIPKNLQC